MSAIKNITNELTTGLPPWAKGVATLAILGGVGFGIYKLIKNLNTIDDKITDNKEEKTLKAQGQKNWYSASQYKEIADTFYSNAIDTYNIFDKGNEEALFKLVGQIKSDLDVIEIRKAFAEKRCTYTFNTMALSAWVNCMYDADEVKTANDILLSKKITFRF